MFVPKKLFSIPIALAVLVGCSQTPNLNYYKEEFEKNPPTTTWLEENVDSFRNKAWLEPTTDNIETFAFVKSLLDERKAAEKLEQEWQEETHMLLTVDWLNISRGGAAFRKAGYRHVLTKHKPKLTARTYTKVASTDLVPEMIANSLDKLSFSERMLAWQRYCNAGEDITAKDWEIILAEGILNVPESLKNTCTPPK